jgi:diaminopimelate decarboxylase
MTVVDQKGEDLVITDAGTNAVGWERFETDYFPVLNLTRPALTEKPCYILGSLCTPHDVWGFSYFGRDIRVGDVLMIPTQGAYTYSLRQNFIKPVPEVVIM